MKNQLIAALNQRYATKLFDPEKKIAADDLDTLLESLRLTPTSYGLQLMKTIVVDDQKTRAALFEHSFKQKQILDASHLLVLCREKQIQEHHITDYINTITTTRKINAEDLTGFKTMLVNSILNLPTAEQNIWMKNQVYIALGNLLTACALLHIDACPMEGFVPQEYDKLLGLDQLNLSSVLVIPIGYRSVNDKNATVKKVRRSKNDFIIRM